MPRRILIGGLVVAVVLAAGFGAWMWLNRPPERSVEAFCSEMTEAQGLDDALALADPDQIAAQSDALHEAAEVAPEEIRGDVEVLATLVQQFDEAVEDSSDPQQALDDALRANQAALTAAEPAGESVQRYVASTCQLELNPSNTSTP